MFVIVFNVTLLISSKSKNIQIIFGTTGQGSVGLKVSLITPVRKKKSFINLLLKYDEIIKRRKFYCYRFSFS